MEPAGKALKSAGSTVAADVANLLRARNPLLWIVTREEPRVERLLMEAFEIAKYVPRFWDCAAGVTDYEGRPMTGYADLQDPAAMLDKLKSDKARGVWVLRDIHKWLEDSTVLRRVRSLARSLSQSESREARSMIVLTPSPDVPAELAGHAIVIDWPLPDRLEIGALLDSAIGSLPKEVQAGAQLQNGARELAIDAAVGLNAEEVQSCFAKSLVTSKKIDPAQVASEKRRVIAREKVLEWYEPLPGGLDAVGGLETLKEWLKARRVAFSPKARAFGLPAPKGALLVGVPGCGKSLVAKAVATAWGMPLLRLDMGALKGSLVGESEANIRKALKVAETVAPCVLWIDEIEKALAGAAGGALDGGVSADALGTILSWMQERPGSVFVVATANDVAGLPPELSRKGRFDELFFVDLPNEREREEILAAALRAHGRKPEDVEGFGAVATQKCDNFTGAEIASLVPEALFVAFADGERKLRAGDLAAAAAAIVPMARTSAEKVRNLREWGKSRARFASKPLQEKGASNTRRLDLN